MGLIRRRKTKDRPTIKWTEEKGQKGKQRSTKHAYKTKD